MARRRKSSSNSKTRETNVKGRSISTESANQEDEEDNNPEQKPGDSSGRRIIMDENREDHSSKPEEGFEKSKDKMMPLDIQQMILGDLQTVGQGEEIIVSRENAGDVMEEEFEEEMGESGTIVESPREEEYGIQTEEEEEDELIFMNEEDDGEENQYVIVVNSNFEANDDADQEVVSIHNLSDLQEGSCEIITVVRESDYDSSQESLDEMDEDRCDNINAVIGTLDGIHCVKISQYNSEDESSNHDESIEEKQIKVTELEAEVACISGIRDNECINIQNYDTGSLEIDKLSNNSEQIKQSMSKLTINTETTENESRRVCTEDFVSRDSNISKTAEGTLEEESDTKPNSFDPLQNNNEVNMDMDIEKSNNSREIRTQIPGTSKQIEISGVDLTSKLIEDHLNIAPEAVVEKSPSDHSFSKLDDGEAVQENQNNKPDIGEKTSSIESDSKNETIITSEAIEDKKLPNIDECSKFLGIESISSRDTQLASKTDLPINKSSTMENSLKKEILISVERFQEDKVTSDWKINEKPQRDSLQTKSLTSLSGNKKDMSSVFESSFVESSTNKNQEKINIVKSEIVVKDEEGKQNLFRSRSGSTDTTGSESGSNSSSSRRRSGRIKTISASKHIEVDTSKSINASSVAVVMSTTTPPVPGFELDKPVKVKSRWRRSSELEMGSGNKRQLDVNTITANAGLSDSTHARSGQPATPPDSPPSEKELEEVLGSFQHLDSNEYHTDRSRSKDAKRMVCDCMLTKEELARGDMGCGEDCLNRLLMIECGARCMLGERCANKRFQNLEYAKCEVFKTELKGYGLKALEDIPEDTFLLEYVGEVLDPKEFRRRAKDYAKDKNLHFYFMALKSDSIIDATQKGNISRFINHSCDPNAETQKWTVNGELRVGFFSKRPIVAGEEITFDYKYQRYGKEAQRCYCKSTSCRGWIGEDPEKENKVSDGSSRSKERREKKKKEDKRNVKEILNDIDLEEEIEKLVLKNRAQTLMLCRLIVRAEDHSSRMQLLSILQKGETACQRLFLDYHGLRLVWSWMMDPSSDTRLKIEILETLAKLPIPNKTMLQDSKVLGVVEKWSTTALTITEAKDRSSTEEESDKTDTEKDKQVKGSDSEKSSDDSNTHKFVEPEDVVEENKKRIVELANDLLKEWSSLKEVFRIPKKERIEQMKEHEREADKGCSKEASEKHDKSYDRHRSQDKYRDYDRREREKDRDRDRDRKRGRDSPDSDRSRKSSKHDDRHPPLTKMERRQLFAIKAAQEDEDRQRRQQECMWQEQVQLAAHELAQAQAQAQAQQELNYPPPHQQWMSFPTGEPNGIPPHLEVQPMFGNMNHANAPPPFLFNQGPHLHQHPPFLDPIHTPPFHNPVFSQPPPLPKQPLLPTPNQPSLLPKQPLLPTPPMPKLPHPHQTLLTTPPMPSQPHPHQQLLLTPPLPSQPHSHQPLHPTPPLPSQPHPHQPLLPNPPMPSQSHSHQPFLPNPPLPNQPYPQNQPLLSTAPPLPNQPYTLGQTLLPNPPLPNQPHPMSIPHYNSQPPLPNQPQLITSQPPPVTPVSYPQDINPPQPLACPQSQFTQPPPLTIQPPLPSLPPTPSPQPVYQNSVAPSLVPVTSTSVTSVPILLPTAVRLPPKWKSAKDPGGRTYYYHVKTRVPQWEPPLWELQNQQQEHPSESETDSSDSSDDDSSEDEEQEEEKMDEEEPEPVEEIVNEDDLGVEELGDSPYEPETMEMFEDIVEDTKKRRKDTLVQERIISPRTAEEIPDKLDKKKIRELKEKLRRQKSKEKLRLKQKNKSKGRSGTSKCEADTSSEPGRKIKEAFRLNMAGVIVNYLNAYRKPECKCGKINNTEDFKHLARKLTHFVMLKELKHCRSVDELECNDNVKHKAKDFIKKYMAKFGPVYQRRDDD